MLSRGNETGGLSECGCLTLIRCGTARGGCSKTAHHIPYLYHAVTLLRRHTSVHVYNLCLNSFDMDPLSATASIIAVLQLSSKILGYLNDVKDASKERAKCAMEASNLHSLLTSLRFCFEEGSTNTRWNTAVRALAVENGPLDQFNQALELLQNNMTDGSKTKKAVKELVWKFKKEEIASILERIERLKTLVEIALQIDHL
jgi:hypothetical protein